MARFYFFLMIGGFILASCNNAEKKTVPPTTAVNKPTLPPPFRYHKLVEVSPGQDYDVLSWGRGSSAVGAFMILHSDSAAAKYTTTTGDLAGDIVDVYNSDMDLDGNPEIIIQAKGRDTVNYTTIYAFEFSNNKAQKLDFPKLTKAFRKGYRGEDNFYIKDGILMREFPIYDGSGSTEKPTGQKLQLQYGLRNNEFTVKQLTKDSTLTKPKKPEAKSPVKISSSETKHKSSKKDKKHTEEKKKKKKHRKHHQRDDDN